MHAAVRTCVAVVMHPGQQLRAEMMRHWCSPRIKRLTSSLPGALQTAIERGLLRADANRSDSPPNLPLVLALAAQIAEGMAFLHARDVLHGDLCGGAAL